jgi:hypothetical protein
VQAVDTLNAIIGWSAPDGSVCVEFITVEATLTPQRVSLNRTYDETSVVFCMQFTAASGCTSMTTITAPRTGTHTTFCSVKWTVEFSH